jgi:hypothetical protein
MTESNSRWPAYARVPPFLPVPLRARSSGTQRIRDPGSLLTTHCRHSSDQIGRQNRPLVHRPS